MTVCWARSGLQDLTQSPPNQIAAPDTTLPFYYDAILLVQDAGASASPSGDGRHTYITINFVELRKKLAEKLWKAQQGYNCLAFPIRNKVLA